MRLFLSTFMALVAYTQGRNLQTSGTDDLETNWAIDENPTSGYTASSNKFVMTYASVADTLTVDANMQVTFYDKNCKDPVPIDGSNAPATYPLLEGMGIKTADDTTIKKDTLPTPEKLADGFGAQLEFLLDPETLANDNNINSILENGNGEMKLCSRFGLGYLDGDFQEVNFVESIISITYNLTAGFTVADFAIAPKIQDEATGVKHTYEVMTYLYQPGSEGDDDTYPTGDAVEVCVRPPKSPIPPKTGGIDKSIITCDAKSQPTFCEAPDASIDCVTLQEKMNDCTAFGSTADAEFVVYDPYNCGAVDDVKPISGCNYGSEHCRACGFDTPSFEPCATGFYKEYYEPKKGQSKENANERQGEQEIKNLLGLPVQVDCDKFYEGLKTIENDALEASEKGQDIGEFCSFSASSFDINYFTSSFSGKDSPAGRAIAACPPQFAAGFSAYGNNARYQLKTTKNTNGTTFPEVKNSDTAVSDIPAKIPLNKYNDLCNSLALGQEINIFDAGEISVFGLTAKTMAERMLRPAYWEGNGIINCVDYATDSDGNTRPCGDYSADVIDDPTTWTNTSEDDPNTLSGLYPGLYEYQIPSAALPVTKSVNDTQSTFRVGKQMHGKGQSCIYAKFSFGPLKENYKNVKEGEFGYIIPSRRVGLLDPKLAVNNVTFDTLVRLSGNKNITDVKDAHDVRIRGFALKLFGVDKAFEMYDLPYNQIQLPKIPAFNQPGDARLTFDNYNLQQEQEFGTLDLLHVAIGSGKLLGTNETLNGTFFDPSTEKGARNPPDNVFVAHNAENYYNGFILGGNPDIVTNSLTDTYQNPLEYIYGSASPLRAGPGASLKLSWAYCPGEEDKIDRVYDNLTDAFKDANYFYTNLKATIQKPGDFKFCGYIQFQENPCTEPLDDPSERWLTDNIKVFELTYPQQTVPSYNTFCDNTVYTPWRTIQEHQPQSFINRVRMGVYVYASLFRLILNNGVSQLKGSNGDLVDTLGQNTCPFGYTTDKTPNRFQPIAVGDRGKYGGASYTSRTQQLDINATGTGAGIIPIAEPDSSYGF